VTTADREGVRTDFQPYGNCKVKTVNIEAIPLLLCVPQAAEIGGMRSTRVYELLGEGKLLAKRNGRFTRVLAEGPIRVIENLADCL
jgi:hypothetical protein